MQSAFSRIPIRWLRPGHLYAALLTNVLPPLVVLVLALGATLSLVYMSALFGGQAWMHSTRNGALPQVFSFVDEEGHRCAVDELRLQGSSCTRLEGFNDEYPQGPAQTISADDLQTDSFSLLGVPTPPSAFVELLSGPDEACGFTVLNDRLLHVAKPTGAGQLLIRDVTDVMLVRLSRAGAVEVELFGDRSQPAIATTFLDEDDRALVSTGPPPAEGLEYRDLRFDRPYRGYVGIDDSQGIVIAGGRTEVSSFARDYIAPSIAGMPVASVVISVPKQAMLGYTTTLIYASSVVVVVVIGWTIYLLRRLTLQQIRPITELAARMHSLGETVRTSAAPAAPAPTQATELESLEYAVSLLETTVRQNRLLERRLRQNDRLEAIGRLTGGIAHDFNNLLGIVVANCGFLREDLQDTHLLESVDDIAAAAESASEMTASLVAFSAGRTTRTGRSRDIEADLTQAVRLVRRSIGANVRLKLEVAGPAISTISSAHLQQVILNLVLNARDAARGEVTQVGIRLAPAADPPPSLPEAAPEDWLCLSVQDDGVGMTEEVLDHIFEPFFTSKQVSHQRGTGLGLSVVYGIVDGLGGHIHVESTVGNGSTFFIFLPRTEAPPGQPDLPTSRRLSSLSAILVDDDPNVRRAVRLMLTRSGVQVNDFNSGREALDWLDTSDESPVDLLITDIRMPQMDGYEVAESFRSSRPSLPVLFITGFDQHSSQRRPPPHSRLLRKPMTTAQLVEAIHELSTT